VKRVVCPNRSPSPDTRDKQSKSKGVVWGRPEQGARLVCTFSDLARAPMSGVAARVDAWVDLTGRCREAPEMGLADGYN